MNELAKSLIADSYAAPPANILEDLTDELARREMPNLPHTIYEELWHMAFWQRITLDWITHMETPFPARPEDGFPSEQEAAEPFSTLRERFLAEAKESANHAEAQSRLEDAIRCPSRPGQQVRVMSVRDQLISLAAHNAYHLGRIVVLRQLMQAWPPTSGGFTW